jgi:hypothetical protein
MKVVETFALFIAVGLILAAGCVVTKINDSENATIEVGIAPISNTSAPGINRTVKATVNRTSNTDLKGSLRVSISGISYPESLSVVLDNDIVGEVKSGTPLYLMISEGNHTVMVCKDSVCEQEEVTTRFGRYVTVDFSERLQRDVKFPDLYAQPTARIIDYYKNGNVLSVNVEFINPSKKDLLMSVILSCGYSYIDDRTSIKMGDSVKGKLVQNVKAGQRITENLDLYFASGDSLSYSGPVIEELQIK